MAMGRVGGIIMLVSLFLPVWLLYVRADISGFSIKITMFYWLFGLFYITIMKVSAIGIAIELISIILFGGILVCSIIAIIKEGTIQLIMGLLSLFGMAAYLIYMDLGLGFGLMMGGGNIENYWELLGTIEFMLIPIGGIVCIIGAILTTWGGAKTS